MMTYLYISSNLKRGKWVAKIEDVRKWVGAPPSIDSWAFMYNYLDKAIEEFREVGTRLEFTYEKVFESKGKRGKVPITKLEFTVIDHGSPFYKSEQAVEEEAFKEEDDTPVQSEKDRWDEWDKMVKERRKQYEKHSV